MELALTLCEQHVMATQLRDRSEHFPVLTLYETDI
jgi:hypothetical protein